MFFQQIGTVNNRILVHDNMCCDNTSRAGIRWYEKRGKMALSEVQMNKWRQLLHIMMYNLFKLAKNLN